MQPPLMHPARLVVANRPTTRELAVTDQVGSTTPPLSWPYYGVSFAEAVKRGYRKWAVVDGRAGFGEYWWFVLFVIAGDLHAGGPRCADLGREQRGWPAACGWPRSSI